MNNMLSKLILVSDFSNSRHDVGIQAEQVGRIVFVLDLNEAFVVALIVLVLMNGIGAN